MPRFTPYTDWNTEETLRKMLGEPFWRDDWRKEIPTGDQIHDMVNAVRRLKDRLKRLLASKKRSQEDKDYFKPLYESRIKSSNKMLDVDRKRKWCKLPPPKGGGFRSMLDREPEVTRPSR